MKFSQAVKTSINGDEYYTQQEAVNMIVPYILQGGYKKVWCPFDKADIFRKHRVEMLIPRGRMKFYHKEKGLLNSPNFQSIYVCNRLLENQIVFDETTF